jgi:hypothetical protein
LKRRTVLRGSLGGAGLAAAALIGCGGEEEPTDDEQASSDGAPSGPTVPGEFVKDRDLTYPFNFPEPGTEPKLGGVMQVAATWDVQNVAPVVSASGGAVTVPNMVYNRLIGFVRGPKARTAPEIRSGATAHRNTLRV